MLNKACFPVAQPHMLTTYTGQDLDSFLKLTSPGHSLRLLPTFKTGLRSLKEEKALNDVESNCNIFNWQCNQMYKSISQCFMHFISKPINGMYVYH